MFNTKVKFNKFNNVQKLALNLKKMNLTTSSSFNDLALTTTRQMSEQDLFKLKS